MKFELLGVRFILGSFLRFLIKQFWLITCGTMHIEQLRAHQLETDFNFPLSVKQTIIFEETSRRILDGAIWNNGRLQLIGSANAASIMTFLAETPEQLRAGPIQLYELTQRAVIVINSGHPSSEKINQLKSLLDQAHQQHEGLLFSLFYPLCRDLAKFPLGESRKFNLAAMEVVRNGDAQLTQADLVKIMADEVISKRKDSRERAFAQLLRVDPTAWSRSLSPPKSSIEFALASDITSLRLRVLSVLKSILSRNGQLPKERELEVVQYFMDGEIRSDLLYKKIDVDEFIKLHPPTESIKPIIATGLYYLTDQGLKEYLLTRLRKCITASGKSFDQLYAEGDKAATIKNIIDFTANYLTEMHPGLSGPGKMSDIWFDILTEELAFASSDTQLAPFTQFLRRSYLKVRDTFLNGHPEAIITYALQDMWLHYLYESPTPLFDELRDLENSIIQAAADRDELNLEEARAGDPDVLAIARFNCDPSLDQLFRRFINNLAELAGIEHIY